MTKKDKTLKKSGNAPKKAVTSDPRFAVVHNDPRFNMPRRRDMKVTIDERFKSKIAAEDDFKRKAVIDKYGRKIARDSSEKEFKRYYNMEDENEKTLKDQQDKESEADSESSSDEEEEVEEDKEKLEDEKIEKIKKPKASLEVASASEDENSSSEEESSSEDEAVTGYNRARGEDSDVSESSDDDSSEEEAEEEELVVEEEEIQQGDETKAFAVVNLDWDNVRAVDLMATFSSFVPPKGRIESVSILPSEYGKMRMEKEDLQGPDPTLFATSGKKKEKTAEELTTKDLFEEDEGEEVDSKSLRKYQLQRLRYYYAVVKCDSIATARNIYDNCDGTEFETTANFFDLRYVPDDMEFDDEPRDKCTMVPADYKPNYFVTDALQHSKVRLTWDETPVERIKLASKAFSRREIDDMDYKAYLASDSESEDEEQMIREDMKSKYKSLLSHSEYGSLLENGDKDDVDMEVTFTPGLDDSKSGFGAGAANSEGESEKEETTIEKYRRKEKERRKQRMEEWKKKNEDDDTDNKKGKKGKNNKKNSKPSAEDSKKTAELELLMMEDGDSAKKIEHFDMKEIMKAEKRAKRKGKKGSKSDEPAPAGMDFEVNVKDDRFAKLFDDHEFAIDPTKPQFKKTSGMEKLLDERRRRAQDKSTTTAGGAEEVSTDANSAPKSGQSSYAKAKFDNALKRKRSGDQSIQDLIAKVKRRSKKE